MITTGMMPDGQAFLAAGTGLPVVFVRTATPSAESPRGLAPLGRARSAADGHATVHRPLRPSGLLASIRSRPRSGVVARPPPTADETVL